MAADSEHPSRRINAASANISPSHSAHTRHTSIAPSAFLHTEDIAPVILDEFIAYMTKMENAEETPKKTAFCKIRGEGTQDIHPNALLLSRVTLEQKIQGLTEAQIEDGLQIIARTIQKSLGGDNPLYQNIQVFMRTDPTIFGLVFDDALTHDEIREKVTAPKLRSDVVITSVIDALCAGISQSRG